MVASFSRGLVMQIFINTLSAPLLRKSLKEYFVIHDSGKEIMYAHDQWISIYCSANKD